MTERVVVFAHQERDTHELCRALTDGGVASRTFVRVDELLACLDEGDADAVLLTEEALTPPVVAGLVAALESQPAWSDLAVVVVASSAGDRHTHDEPRAVDELRPVSNVTLLEPPVPPRTLAATLDSRLRARRRQHEVRDLMDQERAAREQAEQVSSLQGKLLAQACHDLQTPAGAILLWSRMVAMGTVPPRELPRALAAIESSARSQSYVISTLLDASQLIAGELRLNLQLGPLDAAVGTALEAVRSLADASKVRLEATLEPAAGPVLADPERIQRVVWSILTRAIKATPSGETASLRLYPDEAGVRIEVADRSASAELPDQDAPSASPSPEALGLDLTLSKQLIELHGGTFQASRRGAGTVVTLVVPAAGSTGEGNRSAAHGGERAPEMKVSLRLSMTEGRKGRIPGGDALSPSLVRARPLARRVGVPRLLLRGGRGHRRRRRQARGRRRHRRRGRPSPEPLPGQLAAHEDAGLHRRRRSERRRRPER